MYGYLEFLECPVKVLDVVGNGVIIVIVVVGSVVGEEVSAPEGFVRVVERVIVTLGVEAKTTTVEIIIVTEMLYVLYCSYLVMYRYSISISYFTVFLKKRD